MSTASASIFVLTSSHSPRLPLWMVSARTPIPSAASIWFRMSAKRGETSSVGPAPWSLNIRVAMK